MRARSNNFLIKTAKAIWIAQPGVKGAVQKRTMAVKAVHHHEFSVIAKTQIIMQGSQKMSSAITNARNISLFKIVFRNHDQNFLIFSLILSIIGFAFTRLAILDCKQFTIFKSFRTSI